MKDGADQAAQEPTEATEPETDMSDHPGPDAIEGDPVDDGETVVDERAAQAVAATKIPTIVVHYLGFTLKRVELPTGHFPTKAKLIEAIEPAILNKGWNIGSADLAPDQLPEIGCHREKAKAIAAATRAAKAAAPCRLQILDSNGDEIESRTFRQKAETDSGE